MNQMLFLKLKDVNAVACQLLSGVLSESEFSNVLA